MGRFKSNKYKIAQIRPKKIGTAISMRMKTTRPALRGVKNRRNLPKLSAAKLLLNLVAIFKAVLRKTS